MVERVPWAPRVHQPQLEASTSTFYIYSNNAEIIYVLRYIDIGNWWKVPAVANLLVLGKLLFPQYIPPLSSSVGYKEV